MSRSNTPAAFAAQDLAPGYGRIVKRLGFKLREIYAVPESEALPVEHVDLLLQLRQRERELVRRAAAEA